MNTTLSLCRVIPEFNEHGCLPSGVHPATWRELLDRYANTPHRWKLIAGLRAAALSLQAAGCTTLYLDGSFITSRKNPKDFDACWDASGVDLSRIDPVLKIFTDGRAAQKIKYSGEFFPAGAQAAKS